MYSIRILAKQYTMVIKKIDKVDPYYRSQLFEKEGVKKKLKQYSNFQRIYTNCFPHDFE